MGAAECIISKARLARVTKTEDEYPNSGAGS
jgi:hypothetical protein